jgi:uncharacterized protein YciI
MPPSRPRVKDVPRNLKQYFVALFHPGEHWNQTEGAEDLGLRQLAFVRAQFETGRYRAAGPVTDGSEIVAMAIIEAETFEAAQQTAQQDPAVETSRLTVEVHPVLLPLLDAVRAEY